MDDTIVKVLALDTSGGDKYKSVNENYYNKADCCLLVYDITDRSSFEECKNYYNPKIREKCKENVKIVLVGNKNDLTDQRVITPEEVEEFALENNYIFMETSCLKNTNVQDAFSTLIEKTVIELKKPKIKDKKSKKIDKKDIKKEKNIKEKSSQILNKTFFSYKLENLNKYLNI